ncbi:MAG: hypothetical protein B7733_22855 [Myxococcales bacterium FL481]|nr:MAG: hypothetical protein B7733_22855 [Myxococcales bacterium FL481]
MSAVSIVPPPVSGSSPAIVVVPIGPAYRLFGETQPWPIGVLLSLLGLACAAAAVHRIDRVETAYAVARAGVDAGSSEPGVRQWGPAAATPGASPPVIAAQGPSVGADSPLAAPSASTQQQALSPCEPAASLTYAKGSLHPQQPLRASLDSTAALARAQVETRVLIDAHSDASGTPAFNLQLSHDRGERIAGWLRRAGVAADRITVRAFGEYQPSTHHDPDAPEQRRVQVRIEQHGRCLTPHDPKEIR